MSDVLLVAATELELCGHAGTICGVGPVEAAAATSRALALETAAAVLHVGVAGGVGYPAGGIVVGTEAVYTDIAAAIPVVDRAWPSAVLVEACRRALGPVAAVPIGTSARVGSTRAGLRVEAMEGFGVLRAAQLAGVPAIEVRAISNEIGEDDRARWHIDEALAALADALPRLLAALRGS
jgi:futalosine hydrolase